MSEATTRLRLAVVDRALHGPGTSSVDARRAAFDNHGVDSRVQALVDTVARNAWQVTDEQVANTLAAGVCDELSVALAALDEATADRPDAGVAR
jgi:hypothetical protein